MFEFSVPTEKGSMSEYAGQYPIKDMILARKYLIDELYSHPAGTDLVMNIKKKIGIFTTEVIEYFLEDKKPLGFVEADENENGGPVKTTGAYEEFVEIPIDEGDVHGSVLTEKPASTSNDQAAPSNKYSYISRNPRDYKWVVGIEKYNQPQQHQNQQRQEQKQEPSSPSSQECSRENQPPPESGQKLDLKSPAGSTTIDPSLYIKQLNVQLDMRHGCERTFCPRTVQVSELQMQPTSGDNNNEVYVCDFCHWSSCKLDKMDKMSAHLEREGHASASVFELDRPALAQQEEPFISFDKIRELKQRTSVLGPVRDPSMAYVFCPACLFCFGQNIQACATHYECTHRKSDRIYSVARSIEQFEITVARKHSCPECAGVFKRLTELTKHLKESRHLPATKPGQINLFKCSQDNCSFQSIDFFDFKTHLLHHKYFQVDVQSFPDRSVKCTVLVFDRPTEYYHITDYNHQLKWDIQEQLSSIEQSMDTMKGHSDHSEMLKLLRVKKMELLQLKPTK